jgi:hypothetical protein
MAAVVGRLRDSENSGGGAAVAIAHLEAAKLPIYAGNERMECEVQVATAYVTEDVVHVSVVD